MILPRDSLCLRQCGYYCRYSAYKCGYYYRYSAYAWDSVVTIADIQLLSVVTITDIQLMLGTVSLLLPRFSLYMGKCGYYCRYSAYVWDSVLTLEDVDDLALVSDLHGGKGVLPLVHRETEAPGKHAEHVVLHGGFCFGNIILIYAQTSNC